LKDLRPYRETLFINHLSIVKTSKLRLTHDPGSRIGPRQKYISKSWHILGDEKVFAKHHDLPRNSPQLHHDLPSRNTTKTQKPPAKTTLDHKNFFSHAQPQNPSG